MRKGNWVVCLNEKENVFTVLYNGSDKARARATAAKALSAGHKAVTVFRVNRAANLTADSLESSLPKDTF